jgi:hypothetical protein
VTGVENPGSRVWIDCGDRGNLNPQWTGSGAVTPFHTLSTAAPRAGGPAAAELSGGNGDGFPQIHTLYYDY